MNISSRLPEDIQDLMRCPACRRELAHAGDLLTCTNQKCGGRYPVVDGIAVLINEGASVFTIEDCASGKGLSFGVAPKSGLRRLIRRLAPTLNTNLHGARNYARLAHLLLEKAEAPKVLVLGGRILGTGIQALLARPAIRLVETDVSFGPRTALICDAHDIPFADGSFDAVVIQAVLEHVADPQRCAAEIWRVLAPEGLVYSETAFMQPVHGGAYDFTRFTHVGHRRLFNHFEEIDSGVACGPGAALALSYQGFLVGLAGAGRLRRIAMAFARCTAFFWKYFDGFLAARPGGYASAAGVYFLGRKDERVVSDREVVAGYVGL